MEPYSLAWMEDLIPWQYTDLWKEITESTITPTATGEDVFGLEGGFKELIDNRVVDMVHPDPLSAGGILETKRIGDYAEAHGIPMFLHFAGTPVGYVACIHASVATRNVFLLENHNVGVPLWKDLIIDNNIYENGYAIVSDKPGLGVEINEELAKRHIKDGTEFFGPTPSWSDQGSWDRLWN